MNDECLCGHGWDRHAHYRSGDDCGACGKTLCPAYRPAHPAASVWVAVWILAALVAVAFLLILLRMS